MNISETFGSEISVYFNITQLTLYCVCDVSDTNWLTQCSVIECSIVQGTKWVTVCFLLEKVVSLTDYTSVQSDVD